MPLRLRNITFDCAHPTELARWWTMVTGWEEDPGNPNLPDDDEAALVAPDRSLNLLFVKVPEAKNVKNRVHLDLQATDGTRDNEVVRLVAVGATVVADRRRPDGAGWVVMADPEGNEFASSAAPRSGRQRPLHRVRPVAHLASSDLKPRRRARVELSPRRRP